SGKGRRPTWLNEAILAGAALEDFRNPAFSA
ncbi:H-NS family nucleoid-associated regulatory protein, partial [Vibrio parahaemolyticus]